MKRQERQRSFRAIYEAQLMRPPKGATGRRARTFPVMARALRDLPERWLPEDAGPDLGVVRSAPGAREHHSVL